MNPVHHMKHQCADWLNPLPAQIDCFFKWTIILSQSIEFAWAMVERYRCRVVFSQRKLHAEALLACLKIAAEFNYSFMSFCKWIGNKGCCHKVLVLYSGKSDRSAPCAKSICVAAIKILAFAKHQLFSNHCKRTEAVHWPGGHCFNRFFSWRYPAIPANNRWNRLTQLNRKLRVNVWGWSVYVVRNIVIVAVWIKCKGLPYYNSRVSFCFKTNLLFIIYNNLWRTWCYKSSLGQTKSSVFKFYQVALFGGEVWNKLHVFVAVCALKLFAYPAGNRCPNRINCDFV